MTPSDWRRIQKRLMHLGFNPGPIDGIRGRLTIGAVKAFQRSRGLVADGIVGPLTSAALFGASTGAEPPSFDNMPWYDEANRLIGLEEDTGPGSNPAIIRMAEELDLDYAGDDIPWCGLFVAHCIGSTLGNEPLPNLFLRARNWLNFGEDCEPQLGAVIVFWRDTRASGKGHVGFYTGEDSGHYHILGGNQSDAVNIKKFPKRRFLGARWPLTGGSQGNIIVAGDQNTDATDGNEA
ncbi:TIGR02594 family protein [Thalassococcus sp. BH17M4-6]|uniref:NlpC/P60 family protein n=1 Tax=Thalassococcus sp. BH17M4-6 TaxID=3413148 RepID=UPI003BE4BF7E